MTGYLIAADGPAPDAGRATVQRLLAEEQLAWLGLYRPGVAGLLVLFRRRGWR